MQHMPYKDRSLETPGWTQLVRKDIICDPRRAMSNKTITERGNIDTP